MIKKVEESYKHNIVGLLFGPLIKLVEAVFHLLIPLFMKAIIDLNSYGRPEDIPNSISSFLASFIRLFGLWIPNDRTLSDAVIGGVIILIMSIVGFVVTMTCQYIAASTAVKVGSEVRTSLYEKILALSKKDKENYNNARLVTSLNSDTYQVERGVLIFIRLIVRAPFIIFGSIIFCYILDWKIGLAFSFIVPLVLITLFFILRKASKNYVTIQKDLDEISNRTSDTIDGARVIRAFVSQKYENDRFNISNNEYEKESLRVQRNNALINPIVFEITSLVTIIIIFLMTSVLFGNDEIQKTITVSSLIAAMAYLAQIFFATIQLSSVLLDLAKAKVARERIDEIFEIDCVIKNDEKFVKEIKSGEELIRFENVYFSFEDNNEHSVLDNISFSLNKGDSLGIIGGTGSGKSTIINLIERFLDPTKGDVYYKNINLKKYDLEALRKDIGLVNQKSFLFSGTIKSNLLMGNKTASEEDINNALKAAEAYDFVYRMERCLNSEIKEGGLNVSGGQRQRLCIARALIKNPELLILDDSTSALDLLTEKRIRDYLSSQKDMSKIIVSQRVSSISECDNILVIDNGQLVGVGNHNYLLDNCPIYKEIYISQTNKE